jgi:hypothetical protein
VAAALDVTLTVRRSKPSTTPFRLALSGPVAAAIGRNVGTVTVVDDPRQQRPLGS